MRSVGINEFGRTCGHCDDKCVCFYLWAEAKGFEEVCGELVISKTGAQTSKPSNMKLLGTGNVNDMSLYERDLVAE